MMLILQARPLDLNGLDRQTKTYLTQWYMFIGRQGPPTIPRTVYLMSVSVATHGR